MFRLFACMGLVLLGSLALFFITLFQILVWVWPGAEQISLFWLMVNTTIASVALHCLGWYFTPNRILLGDESLVLSLVDYVFQYSTMDIAPLEGRQPLEWQTRLFQWFGNLVQLLFYLLLGWLLFFEGVLLFVKILTSLVGRVADEQKRG